jgi:hypothetical protein
MIPAGIEPEGSLHSHSSALKAENPTEEADALMAVALELETALRGLPGKRGRAYYLALGRV